VPPSFVEDATSSQVVASEGEVAALHCQAKGNPPPNVSWRREDGRRIRTANISVNGKDFYIPSHFALAKLA
jgi:hypothetical protein